MNAEQVAALRMLLASTGWLDRAAEFARILRGSARTPGGLLLVGTPEHEPWHFAAHLGVGLARLGDARRGDSLVVVTPQAAPDGLLERVCDARKAGATILALDRGDARLEDVAHEALTVAPAAPLTFDAAQHLVSAAAGERIERPPRLRARLARLLDTVSGPVSP